VNFNFLDESEKALVLVRKRILKIKREERSRFDLIFLFTFFIKEKSKKDLLVFINNQINNAHVWRTIIG